MSNLSELLPSGGGQNLVEFVASGTLPNGKPVILNSDGTVTVVGMSGSTTIPESIPAGSEAVFNAANTDQIATSFDPNNSGKFVVAYKDHANSYYGTAVVGTISGTSISFGSEYVFNSSSTNYISIAFDPNTTDKFVVLYQDAGNSSYGTSIVGTVSGTSISYGSEVVFNSSTTYWCSVSFDPNTAGKFVVAYRDGGNGNKGTAIVGTVSGTSISYGSEVVFNTAMSNYISVAFDPNDSGKFVVAYVDYGNSEYGTTIAGTVSGTSLSFGSEYVFNSGESSYISTSFDPNTAGKFVVAYRNRDNSNYGTTVVGTVSGTSISFGSEVIFNTGTSYYTSLSFDPNNLGKFVVTYQDQGNSSYGTAIVGTISGTSISYGSEYVFNSASTANTLVSFDPNDSGKFVIVYQDSGNSGYGTAIVGQMAATVATTNLTSTNLIGISSAAASSGGTAKINTWGGINEAQTSLTIASDYYAQTDGTITTATAGQKLGTAISATTINMKDLT